MTAAPLRPTALTRRSGPASPGRMAWRVRTSNEVAVAPITESITQPRLTTDREGGEDDGNCERAGLLHDEHRTPVRASTTAPATRPTTNPGTTREKPTRPR